MDEFEEELEKQKYCAYCGKPIEKSYFMICDNFLQLKYFDSEEDNIFCSEECILDSLFVKEIDLDDDEL